MGQSSGKGLAIAGLVLGLLGFGLGGFVFYNDIIAPIMGLGGSTPTTTNYYSEDDYQNFIATGTYYTLNELTMSITVPANAEVYILFNCNVLYGAAASVSNCFIQINIDSVVVSGPIQQTGDNGYGASVSLQYYDNEDLTLGDHVVSIEISVGTINDVLTDMSLLIQVTA